MVNFILGVTTGFAMAIIVFCFCFAYGEGTK